MKDPLEQLRQAVLDLMGKLQRAGVMISILEKRVSRLEKRLDSDTYQTHTKNVLSKTEAGQIGGRKRAEKLSAKRRSEIAKKAVEARWEKQRKKSLPEKLPEPNGESTT